MKQYAKSFYNSVAWRKARDYILAKNYYICGLCGEHTADIVHHITWITPANIKDVSITLDEKNLMPVCRRCHALIHEGTSTTAEGLVFNDKGELVKDGTHENIDSRKLYRLQHQRLD